MLGFVLADISVPKSLIWEHTWEHVGAGLLIDCANTLLLTCC